MPTLATALAIQTVLGDFKYALQQTLSKRTLGGVCTWLALKEAELREDAQSFPGYGHS